MLFDPQRHETLGDIAWDEPRAWNGDAGLAIYLWHFLNVKAALPGLDAV